MPSTIRLVWLPDTVMIGMSKTIVEMWISCFLIGFQARWNLANDKIWAINPRSFEEVGCIHTAQGLEFDYVGVLIGKDLTYDKASWPCDDEQECYFPR
jgi:Uncharacterized conserved protein